MFEKTRVIAGRVNYVALWSLFWVIIAIGGYISFKTVSPETSARQFYVARIDIYGDINPGLTDLVKDKIEKAYDDPFAKAILFNIESSGGSEAEAWRLCDLIIRKKNVEAKKDEKDRQPTIVTIGSAGVSGAYYLAVCADAIYATPGSLVGSVGAVVYYSEEEQKKLKHIASGDLKVQNFIDKESRKVSKEIVDETAKDFLDKVLAFRGNKLKVSKRELASGRMWTGKKALELGLIDGLGTPESIADDMKLPLLYVGQTEQTTWDKLKDLLFALQK